MPYHSPNAIKRVVYSTSSDLVRFALATNPGSVNGELAGGMVMSLMTGRDSGIVIAVTSNMAHANTSSLAASRGRVRGTDAMIAQVDNPTSLNGAKMSTLQEDL